LTAVNGLATEQERSGQTGIVTMMQGPVQHVPEPCPWPHGRFKIMT